MNELQRIKKLEVPSGSIDVVLDTDAYNEIDDQFAISYLIKSKQNLNTKAIYSAPFYNIKSDSPADGMEKSYDEIKKLLNIMEENIEVLRGSTEYLQNEVSPVISDAAKDLVERSKKYSNGNSLYVVAIGTITNIASAILLDRSIIENIVVVWLGGNARHYHNNREFNLYQDIAAARVVMSSGVPFIQLPCEGVVSSFTISKPEIEHWLKGKNKLSDYLADIAIKEADSYAFEKPWTRCIWDVTAVAWLMNRNERFMSSRLVPTYLPTYDDLYAINNNGNLMRYVYMINRDLLMEDLVNKLTK